MFHAYSTILREEGVSRGLYSGVAPAMTGSREFTFFFWSGKDWHSQEHGFWLLVARSLFDRLVPGTTLYFGTYEYTKRTLTAAGCPDTIAHLAGGTIWFIPST